MPTELLTIGQFATFAETTVRTVLWYEEKGILKPRKVNPANGYRLYEVNQVIDCKAIMLLRKLNFTVAEIKSYLAEYHSPEDLFDLKKQALKQQIEDLQLALKDTQKYYQSLRKTGTLVDPEIKNLKPFPIYYIDRLGPYYKIDSFFGELRSCFDRIPKNTLGLVLYEGFGYRPKNAKVKVCFLVKPGLRLKSEAKGLVKKMVVPGFTALSYTHIGSSKLLSTLWQELKKYRIKKGLRANTTLPFEDLELSRSAHETEMLMPIL